MVESVILAISGAFSILFSLSFAERDLFSLKNTPIKFREAVLSD